MEKYYSKINTNKLLHIVNRLSNINDKQRINIVPEDNFIQCSLLKLENNKTFSPHKHITKSRNYDNQISQESWLVLEGKIECTFYDIDDTILATTILKKGDASFTLYGGHTFKVLQEDTIIYEYKTGPYEGQQLDKVLI
tara:strand:+ start:167 stop:583 length:417 start_codon:yes stop_codon:yes gene_type:complete